MSALWEAKEGSRHLMMGNDAFVRGIIEAGASVAAGYPGTPSSEIIENLAKAAEARQMYVEWSVNEKVAMEVAAAASFAGLRSVAVMKQVGVNVASDFMLHLSGSGTRGGMILISCEDPGALSSGNEGESRPYAKMFEIPLLEPGDFQEAKDMTKWAFELSEKIRNLVMIRSVTRLSHASGNVETGPLPNHTPKAHFTYKGLILDTEEGPVTTFPVEFKHRLMQQKLKKAVELFENCPFNRYEGPDNPKILIVTSSACYLYSKEAVRMLGVKDRVGILKMGTTWPLPPKYMEKYLSKSRLVFTVEEVLPFLEDNVKILATDIYDRIGAKTFFGRGDGTLPTVNELNPDIIAGCLANILKLRYEAVDPEYAKGLGKCAISAPVRELAFCAGCPHRASFWSIHHALEMDGRDGFVCGDIGCYTMAFRPTGFNVIKTAHAMGSGTGIASGFAKLNRFGLDQPVLSVCGDSTFFHAALPALINAIHNNADMTMVVLDNSGTAMTGFQPHPGLAADASGNTLPSMDIGRIARAVGAYVEMSDPFDIADTQQKLLRLLRRSGVNVIILKQICALSPEKKGKKLFDVKVDASACIGDDCGCNKLCTRVFKCPGLKWDSQTKTTLIDEVLCSGCGVCAAICPSGAISKKEMT